MESTDTNEAAFTRDLLAAINDQVNGNPNNKYADDAVRMFFANNRHRYTERVKYWYGVGGTYGRCWRNVIADYFGDMGKLVCDRMRLP